MRPLAHEAGQLSSPATNVPQRKLAGLVVGLRGGPDSENCRRHVYPGTRESFEVIPLIGCISVLNDRMQRISEPIGTQVETWQLNKLTEVTVKIVHIESNRALAFQAEARCKNATK
jgi:hypothetical protein